MAAQPFEMKCAQCGEELEIDERKVDHDYDLIITVHPCQNCKEE